MKNTTPKIEEKRPKLIKYFEIDLTPNSFNKHKRQWNIVLRTDGSL